MLFQGYVKPARPRTLTRDCNARRSDTWIVFVAGRPMAEGGGGVSQGGTRLNGITGTGGTVADAHVKGHLKWLYARRPRVIIFLSSHRKNAALSVVVSVENLSILQRIIFEIILQNQDCLNRGCSCTVLTCLSVKSVFFGFCRRISLGGCISIMSAWSPASPLDLSKRSNPAIFFFLSS